MNWAETETIAKAGAEGELRCEVCGIPVAMVDPLDPARMIWLNVTTWVEDGQAKARCGGGLPVQCG